MRFHRGQRRPLGPAALIAALTIPVTLIACGPHSTSRPATVHIEQSPVKDQHEVGFCWAYAFTGMMESINAERGESMDLSEEYLGFYLLLAQLNAIVAIDDPITRRARLDQVTDGATFPEMATLPAIVGLVPESVWSVKFTKPGLVTRVVNRFARDLDDTDTAERLRDDPNTVYATLADVFGSRPPRPTELFADHGRSTNARDFATRRVGYDPADYRVIDMTDETFDEGVDIIKTALMAHISVPIGTVVFDGIDRLGTWRAEDCAPTGCRPLGGHAMLAVDFVTMGGRAGAMPERDAWAVFDAPLESIIVKNSWGFQGATQTGQDAGQTGFNVITRSYLERTLWWTPLSALVPAPLLDKGGVGLLNN